MTARDRSFVARARLALEVSGAARLARGGIGGEKSRTLLRIENFAHSVDYRLRELRKLLAPFGEGLGLSKTRLDALWRDIRAAVFCRAAPSRRVADLDGADARGRLC